jgi:hypothetical protein
MALTAAIDLTVNKPDFKSMKAEIRELTIAAQKAVMDFGEFSPEAIKAEKALAAARDRMEDFNDRVAAVNPDKFAQINTVVQGVARGFQAAQGAMALFGNQSEELEKTMVKLQGAMALAEGLEGLGKVQQQFGAIAKNIKGNVMNAFKALGNMSTLAFGAIGVALTLIIANFDTLKKAVMSLIPGLSSMVKFVGGLVQQFTDWVGITSAQDRALEKLNKTTDKANEQLDREIALLQARGDQVGVFNKQRQKLENDLAQARANYGKNTEKEWGKIILDTKNALAVLQIEEQNFQNDRVKAAGDKERERLAAIARAKKEQQDKEDELNRKNKEKEEQFQNELSQIEGRGIATRSLLTLQGKTEAEKMQDKFNEERAIQRQKEVDAEVAAEKAKQNAKENLYRASIDLANSLASLAGEQTKTGKAIALSVIAADTAMAISGALKVTQSASPDNIATGGLAGAAKYIGLAAMILTNAKKARDILKGGQPGAMSPMQSSGQGMAQMAAPRIGSTLPQVNGFDQRVYVTEGDISRTQGRVASLKKVSVTQ